MWKKLRAMHRLWEKTPLAAYANQKKGAKMRGIGWEFTLAEWWEIWEKSGKYAQRGTHDGQYVMCRIRDFGPYSRYSVRIKTCNENGHEQRDKRGKWFGKKLGGYHDSAVLEHQVVVDDDVDSLTK